MPRQNSTDAPDNMTDTQRAQRRGRVMNMLARLAHDPDYPRQQFRAKVGGQLAALLARAGVSAAQVARKLNISPAQLSRQLGGDANLTLNSLHNITAAAGATVTLVIETPGSAALAGHHGATWQRTLHVSSIVEEMQLLQTVPTTQLSRIEVRQARLRQVASTQLPSDFSYLEFAAANEPTHRVMATAMPLAVGC